MFAYIDGPFPFYKVLLLSVLFGFLGGLIYECFRLVRFAMITMKKPSGKIFVIVNNVFVFAWDLIYFLVLTIASILFIFVVNRGQLRLSMLAAMSFGFCFYYVTLGKLLSAVYGTILRVSAFLLRYIYGHTVVYLVALEVYLFRISFGRVYLYLKKYWVRFWLRILIKRSKLKLDRLLTSAKNGFINMDDHISVN